MTGILIRRFKISLSTAAGDYGFTCGFEKGLNILRGDNTSGKSTFINAIIYSLGMEELIGGKGPKVLPYALKEYVEDLEKNKVRISNSYVFIEIENKSGSVVTLKRAIVSDTKDSKLIEIIEGPYLSESSGPYKVNPTYLHDKGSAQGNEYGFFSYLESFMSMNLPQVPASHGGETKLYLQTIFSAILIEQKRGWTDYIANTPYYAIRDVRSKIIEYLLNLDVFDNERRKNKILTELSNIQNKWSEQKYIVKLSAENSSIIVSGIKENVDDLFDKNLVVVKKLIDGKEVNIHEYIENLNSEITALNGKSLINNEASPDNVLEEYNNEKHSIDVLISALDGTNSNTRLTKLRLEEYRTTKFEIEDDLDKNKIALKLNKLGADSNFEIPKNICPSCHQHIDDSLLLADTHVQPMTIDENIKYLENQRKMVIRYISGLEQSIYKLDLQSKGISEQISEKREICLSLKKDLRTFDSTNETEIRIKIQHETKIKEISKAIENIDKAISDLTSISSEFKKAKESLSGIPTQKMSLSDIDKLEKFQSTFRELAGKFGYKSAPTNDIEINKDTLFPYLSGIELREVNTDIKSDSSASDFVRLIWAYLLSINSVSNAFAGNHPEIIVFDEPAQHSMAVSSVNALLKRMSIQSNLQSIVAASFDESDEVFNESVDGVSYNLISFGKKLLNPL